MRTHNALDQHARITRAIRLIKSGLRTQLIKEETGLTTGMIRALYTEIHGTSPKSGNLRQSATVIRTDHKHIQAIFFLLEYRRIYKQAEESVDLDAVKEAHRALRSYMSGLSYAANAQLLSIMDTWVLARDYRSGLIEIRACTCGSRYLAYESCALHCPACQMQRNRQARTKRNQELRKAMGNRSVNSAV